MPVVWRVGVVLPSVVVHVLSLIVLHVLWLLPPNTSSANGATSAEGQGVEGNEGDRGMVSGAEKEGAEKEGAEKEDDEIKLPPLSFWSFWMVRFNGRPCASCCRSA